MPDLIDAASDLIQARQDQLIADTSARPPEAEPAGHCLWCEEELRDPSRRWCDAHCRDDWQAYRKHAREHPVVDLDE